MLSRTSLAIIVSISHSTAVAVSGPGYAWGITKMANSAMDHTLTAMFQYAAVAYLPCGLSPLPTPLICCGAIVISVIEAIVVTVSAALPNQLLNFIR